MNEFDLCNDVAGNVEEKISMMPQKFTKYKKKYSYIPPWFIRLVVQEYNKALQLSGDKTAAN